MALGFTVGRVVVGGFRPNPFCIISPSVPSSGVAVAGRPRACNAAVPRRRSREAPCFGAARWSSLAEGARDVSGLLSPAVGDISSKRGALAIGNAGVS